MAARGIGRVVRTVAMAAAWAAAIGHWGCAAPGAPPATAPAAEQAASAPAQELAVEPVVAPIRYRGPFQREREMFGYAPAFQPNVPGFDLRNRPLIRTTDGGPLTESSELQMLVDGRWVRTAIPAILRQQLPRFDEPYRIGPNAYERVVVDREGHFYMALETPTEGMLLFSRDEGRNWMAYRLPDPHVYLEYPAGHNMPQGPPAILTYGSLGKTTLRLVVADKPDRGTLDAYPPFVLSESAFGPLKQAGASNTAVSVGDRVHVLWADAEPAAGRDGTPIYAVTFDRTTGRLSPRTLVGFGGEGAPDAHNQPAVVVDSQGYLHAVLGGHNDPPRYVRSLRPNDASAWTEPEAFGTSSPRYGRARYTYPALVADDNDVLHLVVRALDDRYRFNLAYLRKPPGQPWQREKLLVQAGRPFYSNWYHKLSVDRTGRLFVSYMYYAGELTEEQLAAYRKAWPEETVRVRSARNGRYSVEGNRAHDPALLVSDDGGDTWRLATTADLLAGVQPGE